MVTRKVNCTASLLTPLLCEKLLPPLLLPNPLVCFIHLQASVTLIDTQWNSLKLHFYLKKTYMFPQACREDSQAIMGTTSFAQYNNLFHPQPYFHPCPIHYVPLMNEKIRYQSKNKLNFMWQASLIDYKWV